MIITPLGKIEIYRDNTSYYYEEKNYLYNNPPVLGSPLDGCFRIYVPTENYSSIKCILDTEIEGYVETGENYLSLAFEKNNVLLSIGMIDESNKFQSLYEKSSIEYRAEKFSEDVVFGISWTLSAKNDDCRTWYASDASLDKQGIIE